MKATPAWAKIKVACVGDSITAGVGVDNPNDFYPAVLGRKLGANYDVRNFGHSGATLLNKTDLPYTGQTEYKGATDFLPDIVVLMLGTNDSKSRYDAARVDFSSDATSLTNHFLNLSSHPRLYLMYPPPAFASLDTISNDVIEKTIIPLLKAVATRANLPTIDIHTALAKEKANFSDGIHPNATAAALLADTVYKALLLAPGGGADGGTGDAGSGAPRDSSAKETAESAGDLASDRPPAASPDGAAVVDSPLAPAADTARPSVDAASPSGSGGRTGTGGASGNIGGAGGDGDTGDDQPRKKGGCQLGSVGQTPPAPCVVMLLGVVLVLTRRRRYR